MKSISVKKIAAFAGTALLLGSAVAAADVVYGSTQLVDQNGQPTVKVYVGSGAAISDGVAAANIAAKIANEAFKTSTLTAGITGAPTCSVTAGIGQCSLLDGSKKVTLEVTLPGTVAGTHIFKTLITDTIDRTLENRNNTLSEDVYPATMTSTDTTGTMASPLRAVDTGMKGQNLYRIGGDQFVGFADQTVTDNQAASTSYTEEQSFWIGSQPNAVQYDSSSSIKDVAVNKYSAMAYSVKFSGNDYGIPVCTSELSSSTPTDWTSCPTNSDAFTDKHRVKIMFMGSEWAISEMSNPSAAQPSSTSVISGGQIKLAKEAKYGIVNVGQTLDAGTFKIRLADISVAVGPDNDHPAIIDVLDANEAIVGQIQVTPGQTYTFTNNGNAVKVHVYRTAPGFTLNAKWAEMAIYTDEITLKDGARYNLVSSTDPNENFKVSLLWKNRDWASASDSNVSDSLREIVIYNVDGFDSKTKAGEAVSFLKSNPTFTLTYNGVDLTDADYAPLAYSAQSSNDFRVATAPGDVSCGTSATDLDYKAKMVEIKTNGASLLGGTGDALSGDYTFEKVLFDPIGVAGASPLPNGTQNQSIAVGSYAPKVFYKISGRDCYNWDNVNYVAQSGVSGITDMIKFDTAGDNSAAQGAIYFSNAGFGGFGNVSILYQEDAGKYGTNSNNRVYTGVPLLTSGTDSTFRFKGTDSSSSSVFYEGLGASSFVSYEPTFVSERGSKTTSVGTSDASFDVAKRVGQAVFQFAYSDSAVANAAANDYILGVGDSKLFGDVTVKVKAIDATVGDCSGPNGSPICAVDTANLKAVINPMNTESTQAVQPYNIMSNMVLLDSQNTNGGIAIVVGGPMVNTMAADMIQGTNIDLKTDGVVVKEIGSKILVAGYTAEQTMAAADQFIAGMRST